jgi:hypothetical protein
LRFAPVKYLWFCMKLQWLNLCSFFLNDTCGLL